MMNSSVKIVQVAFAGNYEKLYDFFTDLDNLQVGDLAVCDVTRSFSLGKVIRFVQTSSKATNWIVQRVDIEGHKKRMEIRRLEEMLS